LPGLGGAEPPPGAAAAAIVAPAGKLRSSVAFDAALESEFWRFLLARAMGVGLSLLLAEVTGDDERSSTLRRAGPPPPGLDLGVFRPTPTSGLG